MTLSKFNIVRQHLGAEMDVEMFRNGGVTHIVILTNIKNGWTRRFQFINRKNADEVFDRWRDRDIRRAST